MDSQNAHEQAESEPKDPPWWLLGVVCAFAILLVAAFGVIVHSWAAFVVVLMAGVTALAGGILFGFLFGIPRAPTGSDDNGSARKDGARGLDYKPSTNLEQVSDWLTKILVGVGLVELNHLSGALVSAGKLVSSALDPNVAGVDVLTELVVIVFATVGFLASFLWTRVYYPAIQVGTDIGILGQLSNLKRDVHTVAQLATAPSDAEEATVIEPPPEATDPVEEVFRKIAEFQRAPAEFESDPTADIFAGCASATKDRRLTGRIDKKMQGALILAVRVEGIGGSLLDGEAIFLLHPTLDNPVRRVACVNNAAETKFYSEGTFHVVAILDGGKTALMLDLSKIPAVPKWFVDT
ncbi:MAG: hypothetical protein ABSC08_04635 [Bryobacteraceae bacterium]